MAKLCAHALALGKKPTTVHLLLYECFPRCARMLKHSMIDLKGLVLLFKHQFVERTIYIVYCTVYKITFFCFDFQLRIWSRYRGHIGAKTHKNIHIDSIHSIEGRSEFSCIAASAQSTMRPCMYTHFKGNSKTT